MTACPGHPFTVPFSLVTGATRARREALTALSQRVTSCRACPRLVEWREEAAANPRRSFAGEVYWGRPLAGLGDADAKLVLVGLAPAAHGGNRTGRMFTGDQSGDFLFAALWRAGFASQPESRSRDDGLVLRGAYVTAAVRCAPPANKPAPDERDRCLPYLAEELALLDGVVLLCLGGFAYDALRRLPEIADVLGRPAQKFGHAVEVPFAWRGRRAHILCSYHPSQQNVFTGRLTAAMFDAVLARAKELISQQ